jgi:hypothetical protein
MKIYPVQHIAMLELAHGNVEPPVYKADTYRGQEEDEWQVSKIVNHEDMDDETWYEVKWTGYDETTWEPLRVADKQAINLEVLKLIDYINQYSRLN